ncbi:hypothetical protein E2C01_087417 [Portunus trituberculatus]|uniref:Uncharacterized protein n=1 Tax=Portunus trituberculatus TaxID=210409 RepID=A0A5B7JDA8_PORTR|nr:hypothetical protein [Portunus trituberculatus]
MLEVVVEEEEKVVVVVVVERSLQKLPSQASPQVFRLVSSQTAFTSVNTISVSRPLSGEGKAWRRCLDILARVLTIASEKASPASRTAPRKHCGNEVQAQPRHYQSPFAYLIKKHNEGGVHRGLLVCSIRGLFISAGHAHCTRVPDQGTTAAAAAHRCLTHGLDLTQMPTPAAT